MLYIGLFRVYLGISFKRSLKRCSRCLVVLLGVSEGSVLVGWNQASAIIPLWKNFEKQNIFHRTQLRHQNIKTRLCKLSENHQGMSYLLYFRPVREIGAVHILREPPEGGRGYAKC